MVPHLILKLWGPTIFWASSIYSLGPRGSSRGRLWPRHCNASTKIALGYSRGRFSPRPVQSLLGRKGKNGIETTWKKSKISVPIEKGMLERVNNRGKLPLLPFNTLHMTGPYSPAFSTTSNHSGYGLMGQVSVLEC